MSPLFDKQKQNRKRAVKAVAVLVLFILGLVLWTDRVLAEFGVSVSPVKYSFEANPGQVIEDTLVVSNPNDFAIKGKTEFQDFKVTEGNGIQWIPNDVDNPYKMTDWISINGGEFTLAPKEERKLPFKVTIPATATVGGHYAALFFTGMTEGGVGNVGIIPRVGALVLMNVLGELKKTGQLISFVVPSFVSSGPVKLSANFMNTGTTHYETKADFTIKNIFWKSAELSSKTAFAYPNIERDLIAEWDTKVPFGIYTAQASVKDGDGTVHQQSRIFIGLPYRYLLMFIGVVAVISAGVVIFKKKFKIIRAN